MDVSLVDDGVVSKIIMTEITWVGRWLVHG